MTFLSCPPVYFLPGTWELSCKAPLLPHLTLNPNFTFGISVVVILLLLTSFGVYKSFFANKTLADPWDDHDD